MNRKAFTLIEVMVVLSILAIIAILAYNFFGGTMKEATLKNNAVKFWRAATILDAATSEYYRKNGSYPANTGDLVSAGIIKAVPEVPTGGSWSFRNATGDRGGPTVAADIFWEWSQEDNSLDAILTETNNLYTSLGATLPDPVAAPVRTDAIFGGKTGTTQGFYIMVEPK